jgi:hypothetical protein
MNLSSDISRLSEMRLELLIQLNLVSGPEFPQISSIINRNSNSFQTLSAKISSDDLIAGSETKPPNPNGATPAVNLAHIQSVCSSVANRWVHRDLEFAKEHPP